MSDPPPLYKVAVNERQARSSTDDDVPPPPYSRLFQSKVPLAAHYIPPPITLGAKVKKDHFVLYPFQTPLLFQFGVDKQTAPILIKFTKHFDGSQRFGLVLSPQEATAIVAIIEYVGKSIGRVIESPLCGPNDRRCVTIKTGAPSQEKWFVGSDKSDEVIQQDQGLQGVANRDRILCTVKIHRVVVMHDKRCYAPMHLVHALTIV